MLNAVEYLVRVKPDGTIPRNVSLAVRDKLKSLVGKEVAIIVGEWKPPRSNAQNRYYWGVIVKRIHKVFIAHGNNLTRDQVHEYLKEYVGMLTDVLILPNGQKRHIVRSTTSLDTAEWEVFMERCRVFAAQVLDLQIPLPNEVIEGEDQDD